MAKRKRIGLSYLFNNNTNSGIVNYIYNIVAALNTLDDEEKPILTILCFNDSPIDYLKSINYPYLNFLQFFSEPKNRILKKINFILYKGFKKNFFIRWKYYTRFDYFYPYFGFSFDEHFQNFPNKVYWLVDFNNRAFPEHYEDKGESNKNLQESIVHQNKTKVVLSSETLFEELKKYHPKFTCDVRILKFASTLPKIEPQLIKSVLDKFQLKQPFILSPNQFWQHKNQMIVLEALHIIQQNHSELKFKVLFTGSLQVNRGKGLYAESLKQKIDDYGLSEYVLFLGVVERNEQLALMKSAIALLQPSLYEGWSTLVEEAKSLEKFILLSNLPVHLEQISENVDFFDPYNAEELATKMIKLLNTSITITNIDYNSKIKYFAKNFINIME